MPTSEEKNIKAPLYTLRSKVKETEQKLKSEGELSERGLNVKEAVISEIYNNIQEPKISANIDVAELVKLH